MKEKEKERRKLTRKKQSTERVARWLQPPYSMPPTPGKFPPGGFVPAGPLPITTSMPYNIVPVLPHMLPYSGRPSSQSVSFSNVKSKRKKKKE